VAFGTYETLADALSAFQVAVRKDHFVQPRERAVDERFREQLEFFRANAPVDASEQAICEYLISPVLREIWRPYSDALTLWSHVAFTADKTLSGFPDYFVAKRSPLGPIVRDRPYVLFMEAKKDNFDAGWGQCLAAMVAAQKLNNEPEGVIYGGASNGGVWYLGKLEGKTLIQDPRAFSLDDLPGLFGALDYVFDRAKARVLAYAG
jgi:hypothetical protein